MTATTDQQTEPVSYRDHPAISQSDVKTYFDNKAAFHAEKILGLKRPQKTTPAMTFGTKVDTWLLSPQDMVEIDPNVLTSNGARRGKAWDAFAAAHEGKMLISADDVEIFDQIRLYAKQYHERAYRALFVHEKDRHVQMFWDCPHTGLKRKAELDAWYPELNLAVDIKTTQDPTPEAFELQAWKYGYHIQAATYIEALEAHDKDVDGYLIIAIRNEWPYDCEVHEVAAETLAEADEWNRQQMQAIAEDIATENWLPSTAREDSLLRRPASFYAARRWERD